MHLTTAGHAILELVDPDTRRSRWRSRTAPRASWCGRTCAARRRRCCATARATSAACGPRRARAGAPTPRIRIDGRARRHAARAGRQRPPAARSAPSWPRSRGLGRHAVVADGDPIAPPLRVYVETAHAAAAERAADRAAAAAAARASRSSRWRPGRCRWPSTRPASSTGPRAATRCRGASSRPKEAQGDRHRRASWARPASCAGTARRRRNAWTRDTIEAIADAIEAAGADEAVRCVVVRGAGEHFSAGDDLFAALEADDGGVGGRRSPPSSASRAWPSRPPCPCWPRSTACASAARSSSRRAATCASPPTARASPRPRSASAWWPRTRARCCCPRCSARRRRASCCSAASCTTRTGRCAQRLRQRARRARSARRPHRRARRSLRAHVPRRRSRATKAMLNARSATSSARAMEREERACVELFAGPDAPAALRPSPGGRGSRRHAVSSARCPRRTPSPRSPRTPGSPRTRSTSTCGDRPTSWRSAATACSSSRPRGSQKLVREGRGARATASCSPPTAPRGCSRSARRCRRCPPARPRAACRSTWRARSQGSSTHAALDICHVHEPFAPSRGERRPAPLARAQRRRLPRADRARRRHPGRAQASSSSCSAASTRAGELPRHRRPAAPASSPASTASSRPAPRRRGARCARSAARVRIAFVDDEERAALRLFLRALRRLDPALDWEATVVSRARAVVDDAAARRAARARHVHRGRRGRAARARRRARRGLRRRGAAARARAARASPPARCPLVTPPAGLRGGHRRRRAAALLFAPRDADTLAAGLERLIAEAPLRERLRGRRALRRARVERGGRRARGRLQRARGAPARRSRATPLVRAPDRRAPIIDVDLHMHTDHSRRLRDAGRGAAGDRPRPGARRDRHHRPQRDLRRLEAARDGRRVRRQGDRRRGGQDGQPGRGDRPLPPARRSRAG